MHPGGRLNPEARLRPSWRRWLLSALRIEPTDDMHEPYRFLEEVRHRGRPVTVATWPSTRYNIYWPNRVKRPVTLVTNHLALLFAAWRGLARGEAVILREFTNGGLASIALLLWPWRRRLLLNVNDNFSPAAGLIGRLGRALLLRLGFTFMLLDGDAVAARLVRTFGPLKLVTPYFAVPDRRPARASRWTDRPFRVGFVGYFRRDKGGVDLLAAALRSIQRLPGVEVALGYWNRGQADELPDDVRRALVLCDTLRYPAYLAFLDSCDVVVLLATPAYELRHSGVLVDCASRGTPVLCRDYPLLASQALRPVPVGMTYGDVEDLPACVAALRERYDTLIDHFDPYLHERAVPAVRRALEQAWETVAAGKAPSHR